jgi:hypothetical protein
VTLHDTATCDALVLDHAPIVVRLAVLLARGLSQKHDPTNLAVGICAWEQGRSSLQPISAILKQYSPPISNTYQSQRGQTWRFGGANPRRRASSAFSPASNAQGAAGAVTVGIFLSHMMDQVNQAIINAKNAGLTIEIQAGTEAAIAISNAQNAFTTSSDKLFDQHLDPTIAGSLDKIQQMVNDVSANAFKTVDEAATRGQQIIDTLPFRNGAPQVTSITPKFIVPSQTSYTVLVRVKGNFVNAGQPGYDPTLSVNGKQFTGAEATQELQFTVPVAQLSPVVSNSTPAFSFGTSQIDLNVPWSKPAPSSQGDR